MSDQSGQAGLKFPAAISTLSQSERTMLLVVFLAWCGLLLAGLLVPTAEYREVLSTPSEAPFHQLVSYSVIVFLCYTITNVPLLCCLAAVLGAIGGRARIEVEARRRGEVDHVNPYASAVLRAFFVYLVVLSGTMVSIENPVENFVQATQEQYVRLAVMLSMIGFLAGYNPGFFSKVLRGAEDKLLRPPADAPASADLPSSDQ